MAFLVHRAERADLLVEGLADLLRTPLADVFAQELVLVPARGVERWLSQRLSHRLGHAPGRDDGVCAGVEFRSPHSLISEVLGTRDEDPWAPDAVAWPLLRVLDAAAGEPWAKVLNDHLGQGLDGSDGEEGELRRGRRYSVARRLAGLFSSYADQRPAVLDDWAHHRDSDGFGRELPADLGWQPELWRRLLAEVGVPGPTQRHREVVGRLQAGAELELPPRLSLFGHTRLSQSDAELLATLGQHRDVHLWLPHPSDVLWQGLVGEGQVHARRDDTAHAIIDNPLLAAMSRDVRELQGLLERVGAVDAGASAVVERSGSLLAAIQEDVAQARRPSGSHPGDLDGRRSVQVHACHGPSRQVEVLREVLLGLLEDDPTLQPRDIVVMCPDIEAYAPLITATFGLGESVAGAHPGHRLRVQLADRAPSQTNSLLDVAAKLLDLADGRAEATRVLDLLATEPVSRRFGFSDSDHESMARWVGDSGVRWGWEASGREPYGLSGIVQNTWRFGLDRVLTGVALSEDSRMHLDRALPLDDVSSTSIGLAGRMAEAINRLQSLTAQLRGAHPVAHWLDAIRTGLDGLADVAPGEEWQRAQVHRELALMAQAATGDTTVDLRLPDVRALLHRQLGGRPTRANFRTGTLTMCTMTPMRSVPHRVVCLLGLDDQVFPRGVTPDGDDVLGRDPLVGERDVRAQDRQLFLDAVMSATDTVVITYTGFNESTGLARPPAVPLREFLDTIDATAPERADVLTEHHSQPFHTDYLVPAALRGVTKPFSFDLDAPRAARAALSGRSAPTSLADLRLAPLEGDIDLAELIETLTNPVRSFLKHRLEIAVPREADQLSDQVPVRLDGLTEWQIGDRLLRDLLAGRDVTALRDAEWRRGNLPPGKLGWAMLNRLISTVGPLSQEFESATQGIRARSVDVDIELGDGRRLTGTVEGVHDNRLVRVGYSRLRGKQRITAWLDLAALTAQRPGDWIARTIGRDEQADRPAMVSYRPINDPLGALQQLVALRDALLCRPVPLGANTSRVDVENAQRNQWQRNDKCHDAWRKENSTAELALVFGGRHSWQEASALRDDDGQPLVTTIAQRLWAPIREVEA